MKKLIFIIFISTLHSSFLYSDEKLFKFTFGSNLLDIPFEINKASKKINLPGGKINSWALSPNFSSLKSNKKIKNFSEKNEILYIKFNFKF